MRFFPGAMITFLLCAHSFQPTGPWCVQVSCSGLTDLKAFVMFFPTCVVWKTDLEPPPWTLCFMLAFSTQIEYEHFFLDGVSFPTVVAAPDLSMFVELKEELRAERTEVFVCEETEVVKVHRVVFWLLSSDCHFFIFVLNYRIHKSTLSYFRSKQLSKLS